MNEKQLTYCNPLVLPDYPLLAAKHPSPRTMPGGGWDREGKTLVSERDLIHELYPERPVRKWGPPGARPTFRRLAENDVRSTADPSVMYWEGRWYLYCSGGYVYDTDDFVNWTPHVDETWLKISTPMAPTVAPCRGKFYATANSVPLHVADSPLGPWTKVGEWLMSDGREMLANDPMIFLDDDGRLYLYWGLGSGIFGAELDPEQPNRLLTMPKHLFEFNGLNIWEHFGGRNEDWSDGCMEGSWMYKHDGTYYLTYSVCGTEYYSYCMGAYVCDTPLGDFRLQKRNPVSRSDSGLIRGGGHGSIVDGPNGTIWCFYTIPVGIDHIFERRIGMDPCGIDADGCLYARTGLDVPQFAPGVLAHPEDGNSAGLEPCTFFSLTDCSSYAPGHRPMYAFDEVLHTWWEPAAGDEAPMLAAAFRAEFYISALRIIWKDVGLDFQAGVMPGPYRYVVEAAETVDSEDWKVIVDASQSDTDLAVDFRTFPEMRAAKARLRILSAPQGITPGVISLTVFGVSCARRDVYGK